MCDGEAEELITYSVKLSIAPNLQMSSTRASLRKELRCSTFTWLLVVQVGVTVLRLW